MYLNSSSLLILLRFFTAVIISLATFLPFSSFAEENIKDDQVIPIINNGVVVASVNLSNAMILNQNTERFVMGFTLENQGSSPQFDIKYGVELLQINDGGTQVIIDSLVGEETLTLSAGQKLDQIVEYPLSSVAPGTYSVWVSAKTTGGVMLGLGNAGLVTVKDTDSLEIKVDTCVLKVVGEENTYTLYQGVDISATENLELDCLIKNHSSSERTYIPQYETYRRTVFGEKIPLTYPEVEAVSMAPYEEKNLKLIIPKATEPQAYDVSLILIDVATKESVSNRLVVHYVLQGESATIQTVALDKSYYQQGDEIQLNLFWTASADSFIESRQGNGTKITGNVTAFVEVVDEKNNPCSDKVLQTLDKQMVTIKTIATKDCTRPAATVLLIGPSGATLDARSIAVKETNVPAVSADDSEAKTAKNKGNSLMTVTIIAFAITFTTILFVAFRKKRTNTLV